MGLAGKAMLRTVIVGAFGGVAFLVLLSRLGSSPDHPAETPPSASPKASRVTPAVVAPPDVRLHVPATKPVRVIQIWVPDVAPLAEPVVLPPPPPQVRPLVRAPAELAEALPPKPRFKRAALGKPTPGRFARFCRQKGRDRFSWMKVNGRKRYCK